jgi:ribosomal protein L16/L10AE
MVSAASIEAARKAIRKAVKKTGQVVMRTWAYLPILKNQRKYVWVRVKVK